MSTTPERKVIDMGEHYDLVLCSKCGRIVSRVDAQRIYASPTSDRAGIWLCADCNG